MKRAAIMATSTNAPAMMVFFLCGIDLISPQKYWQDMFTSAKYIKTFRILS
jgi:hypothetical protein